MERKFSAVKFKTVFESRSYPEDVRNAELKKWCRIFHDRGLARPHKYGSFGNLSYRAHKGGNSFIITGSGVRFGDEWVEDPFVKVLNCDVEKAIVYAEGTREPSSESLLHYSIYAARPEVNAVFHGHSREVLARADDLGLQQTVTEEPYGSVSLARSVLDVLNDFFFISIRGHGFIALGTGMEDAGGNACRVQDLIQKGK